MLNKISPIILLSSLLLGCGSSSDNTNDTSPEPTETVTPVVTTPEVSVPDESTPTYTGMFLDSAVQGLTYSTETQSGTTNELGEFSFKTGELVTFSIGDISLPPVAAEIYITPLEVFQTDDISNLQVVNLLRLLQTLDVDGDASNGIEINEATHQLATTLSPTVDFASDDFEQQVLALVSQSGAVNTSLIPSTMAIDHFQLTLDELTETTVSGCTSTHEKVGYSGYFSTRAHNVSGLATIIDDCTIVVSEFSYDGGGPEVYFYGAIDHQYAEFGAFAIGPKLSGNVYDNKNFTLKLPQGITLDDLTGLSVWCVDFDANFGQMEFTP